jgi:hypothetical protein
MGIYLVHSLRKIISRRGAGVSHLFALVASRFAGIFGCDYLGND